MTEDSNATGISRRRVSMSLEASSARITSFVDGFPKGVRRQVWGGLRCREVSKMQFHTKCCGRSSPANCCGIENSGGKHHRQVPSPSCSPPEPQSYQRAPTARSPEFPREAGSGNGPGAGFSSGNWFEGETALLGCVCWWQVQRSRWSRVLPAGGGPTTITRQSGPCSLAALAALAGGWPVSRCRGLGSTYPPPTSPCSSVAWHWAVSRGLRRRRWLSTTETRPRGDMTRLIT